MGVIYFRVQSILQQQQMGKPKQQQRQKLKKVKITAHDKSKMKQVMAKLAESKLKNITVTPQLTSIAQMNVTMKAKKILKKKEDNKNKNQKREKEKEKAQVEIEIEAGVEKGRQKCGEDSFSEEDSEKVEAKPVVNLFAVDNYQSEKPVVARVMENTGMDEEDLESKARKVMGADFSLDKFGDRPLKMIDEKEEPIVMSEDEQDKKKVSPHQNLMIPEGNFPILRTKEIEQFRKKLPIYMKEQEIVETINNNLVTLVCGETGSGKSTQLPQFLAEKNYQKIGKIAITQPRRLATTSLARRVASQMRAKIGKQIAYQVRHDRKQSEESYIKFMTDGILLKEMSSDPLLLDYSVVIIDEAHERKVNTDILIGLLSKLILLRYKMSKSNECYPLRLVVMSATLRISDFQNTRLFNFFVPVLNVESKMFPVTIFHQKNTPSSYIDSAIKKCVKIHKTLPPGDVLVFLTGKEEIHEMKVRLEVELDRAEFEQHHHLEGEDDEEVQVEGEKMDMQEISASKFIIYPLYSSLPIEEQDKIFKPAAAGTRKFIISTNISETSITVPNIRYVIDSGQEKHRYFDGIWKWRKGWGSKAMAAQRAGRAGRTAHGYCYRLYSSALYANIMEEFPDPEIVKQPLENILLEIKAIGFKNSFGFPFPTPPQPQAILKALQQLIEIKAIEGDFNHEKDQSSVTELGKVISFIPLSPKLANMLLLGRKNGLELPTLLCTLLLTVESIYKQKFNDSNFDDQNEKDMKKEMIEKKNREIHQFNEKFKPFKNQSSDLFTAINIVGYFISELIGRLENHKKERERDEHNRYQNHGGNISQLLDTIKSLSNKLDLNSNTMRQFYYNCDQLCEIYETLTSSKISLKDYKNIEPSMARKMLDIFLKTFPSNTCHWQQNNKYSNYEGEKVYIHRMSPLYKKKKLFIGCVEFFESSMGRKYMRYPFIIENYQLLSSFGRVSQPHEYVWREEELIGISKGQIFGWEIPKVMVREIEGEEKYFAFAKMFMNGTIFPSFAVFEKNKWFTLPLNAIRPDNLDEKVQKLVASFRVRKILNKNRLVEAVHSDPQFLKKQLKIWLDVKNFAQVFETVRKTIKKSVLINQ